MKAKELFKEVAKRHPQASRKDMTRAAFYAVIVASEQTPNGVDSLHGLAITSRNSGGDGPDDSNGR